MIVERIETEHGSHIEPPLDQSWSDLEKLEWQAACVTAETGIEHIQVTRSDYRTSGILQRGYYCVQVGYGHSIAPLNFYQAWSYLNGVARGTQVRDEAP
jgi:hypothetical protein